MLHSVLHPLDGEDAANDGGVAEKYEGDWSDGEGLCAVRFEMSDSARRG